MAYRLSVHKTVWPLVAPFQITGYVFDVVETIEVQISDGEHIGRGEASGLYYKGETCDGMLDQVEALRSEIEAGMTLDALQLSLPACGARNAIDCALWDLKAQSSGQSIWSLTGIQPRPIQTVNTVGIEESPEAMAHLAREFRDYPVLKVKLDGDIPIERMTAIRNARPDATLVIDANQGFTFQQLVDVAPKLAKLGVEMIEQPLPRGEDSELAGFESPVPICADESCWDRSDLDHVFACYDMINIKLDKTGGLSEALAVASAARAAGKKLMVGNMMGTSLSTAPAYVIAQLCDFVDLDGPLGLKSDYLRGMRYDGATVLPPKYDFWGGLNAS